MEESQGPVVTPPMVTPQQPPLVDGSQFLLVTLLEETAQATPQVKVSQTSLKTLSARRQSHPQDGPSQKTSCPRLKKWTISSKENEEVDLTKWGASPSPPQVHCRQSTCNAPDPSLHLSPRPSSSRAKILKKTQGPQVNSEQG
jgi:hypothetical protein